MKDKYVCLRNNNNGFEGEENELIVLKVTSYHFNFCIYNDMKIISNTTDNCKQFWQFHFIINMYIFLFYYIIKVS